MQVFVVFLPKCLDVSIIQDAGDVRFERMENGYAVFRVASGNYKFESAI